MCIFQNSKYTVPFYIFVDRDDSSQIVGSRIIMSPNKLIQHRPHSIYMVSNIRDHNLPSSG